MGLLDDAIREHLELKRRRGADPNEVERLEREALGPTRRPQGEVFEAPDVAEAGSAQGYRDGESAENWNQPGDDHSFADHGTEFAADDVFEDWAVPEREPIPSGEGGPAEGGRGVEGDAPGPAPPTPADEAAAVDSIEEHHYVDQDTVEHDVEAEHLEHSEEDDMLEETPEFLQDTPDHDRLWFEQRPPRDFDLDG